MSPAPAKAKAKPRAAGAAAAAKGPSRLAGAAAAAAAGRSAGGVSLSPKAAFGRTISSPSPVVERKKAAAVKRKPKSECGWVPWGQLHRSPAAPEFGINCYWQLFL
jgi:hypothetical protein